MVTRRGSRFDEVLRAFRLRDAKLEAWLIEKAQQFAELTARQRDSKMRELNAEIEAASAELREQRKAIAIEEIERQFSPEAA